MEAAASTGDHGRAAELADDAIADDALDEEAVRTLMRAHVAAGSSARALAAFDRLRTTLVETLGADPSPESEALHVDILRGITPEGPPRLEALAEQAPIGPSAPDPGFVGREHELATLAARWADAVSGRPSMVAIRGEAGIGKTSLARELASLAQSTGGRVVFARCYEAERSLFLQPILEAIRTVALSLQPDELRDAASERTGTLADLVPEIGRYLRPHDYVPPRRSWSVVAPSRWSRPSGADRSRPALAAGPGRPPERRRASDDRAAPLPGEAREYRTFAIVATVRSDEGEGALALLGDQRCDSDLGLLMRLRRRPRPSDGCPGKLPTGAGPHPWASPVRR